MKTQKIRQPVKKRTVVVSGPSADELHRIFRDAEGCWHRFEEGYVDKVEDLIEEGMRYFCCDLSTKTGCEIARYLKTLEHDRYDGKGKRTELICSLRSEDLLPLLTYDDHCVWIAAMSRVIGGHDTLVDNAACVLSFDQYPDDVPAIQRARSLGVPVYHYDPQMLAQDMSDKRYAGGDDDE